MLIAFEFLQSRAAVATNINLPIFKFQQLLNGEEDEVVVFGIQDFDRLQRYDTILPRVRLVVKMRLINLPPLHVWQLPYLATDRPCRLFSKQKLTQ